MPAAHRDYIYARVSHEEHHFLRRRAAERKQSVSAFVRDCINALLFDENPDGQLLDHHDNEPRGPDRSKRVNHG